MLAHAASAQGRVAMGVDVALDLFRSGVLRYPKPLWLVMTEAHVKPKMLNMPLQKTMYGVNGKAHAMGETDGIVKIIYSTKTRCILGVHVVGEHAADLAAEAYQLIHNLNTVEEVRDEMIHAHPTLSELIVMALANAK